MKTQTFALALASRSAIFATATQLDRVTVSASTSRAPDSEAVLPNTITVMDREQLQQPLSITQEPRT